MRTVTALFLTVGLSGCVTPTAPVSMGEGRYMIGVNARGGFSSNSQLLADTIRRANEFCAAMNKDAVVENTNTRGAQGWTPQDAQVVFRCVDRVPATSP
jgi:hypothetical protein